MKLADRFTYLFMLRACWRLADTKARRMIIAFFGMNSVANLIALLEPLILAKIVETITRGGDRILHTLIYWSMLWLLTIALFWCLYGPGRIVERKFAFAVRKNLTQSLFSRVTGMPWA